MNWNTIKGQWNSLKGQVREQWGELTDDDLERAKGEREQLAGVIQKRYGKDKQEASAEVDEWARNIQAGDASQRRYASEE